jgi:hypothetical protein
VLERDEIEEGDEFAYEVQVLGSDVDEWEHEAG